MDDFFQSASSKVGMDRGGGGGGGGGSGVRKETNDPSIRKKETILKSDKVEKMTKHTAVQKEDDLRVPRNYVRYSNDVPTPAQKLNAMTAEKRNHGLYDLHCVSEIVPETPEFVATKIEQLEVELSRTKINTKNRGAYDKAKQTAPKYASDMRLRFLRSDRFNVEKAADRMLTHVHVKEQLFGSGSVGRDLVIDDLSEEDWTHINTGCIQVLSQRDQKGRAVIVLLGKLCVESLVQTTLRLLFFVGTTLVAKDEGIQKTGVVLIYYGIGQKKFSQEQPDRCLDICSSLPIRIEGAHACYDNPSLARLFDIASHSMTSECLVRFRTHSGTHAECQDRLRTFGIPIDKNTFPLSDDGVINTTHLYKWFQSLGQQRTRPSSSSAVASMPSPASSSVSSSVAPAATAAGEAITPSPMDVIMGRGRRGQKSEGNRLYKQLLLKYSPKYESATNYEKILVADHVSKLLKERGCRFIKASGDPSGGWVEVSEERVRQKISHAFRNLRESNSSGTTK